MLTDEALRRVLEAAGLDAPVRYDDVVTSTNDVAASLARDGAPAWTLVAAGHQTAGRGRRGRSWIDRPGAALMFSVILRPSWEPARLGLVSLAAGAAMAEAGRSTSGLTVRCDWPNDLLVDDRKVGGILAESEIAGGRVRHVVVGVGVNLVAPDDVPDAAALGPVDAETTLSRFLGRLRELLTDEARIPDAWRAVAATLGRRVEAVTVGGVAVRGDAADVDDTGALLIDTDAGRVRVAAGDVHRVRDAPA